MKIFVFNWGFGVESSAQLCRWFFQPSTRPFRSWKQVVVVSAQTGDEFWRTKELADLFILPLLRKVGCLFFEIGKAGPLEKDGYVILSATTQPYVLHIRSEEIHSLGDNMEIDGWVPRLNRPHLCAQKWKGKILDQLIGDIIYSLKIVMRALAVLLLCHRYFFHYPFLFQYILFLLEEPIQIGPYLGYNANEMKRMKDSLDYGCHGESFVYPLIEDGWTRDDCLEYLYQLFQVVWHKSCCDHCPFQSKINRRKHYADDPIGASRAMWREYIAMAANPRMKLFDSESVREVCEEIGQHEAIARFEARVAASSHNLYYVRRIYRLVGNPAKPRLDAARKIEIIASGSQSEMVSLLQEIAESRNLELQRDSHWRVYSHVREAKVYPAIEGFWVVSPAVTREKCARKNFDQDWRQLCLKNKVAAISSPTISASHPKLSLQELALVEE